MNKNLIPKQIVDKNGRRTTVHVRASKEAGAAKPLPLPTVSTPAMGLVAEPTRSQTQEHTYLFEGREFPIDDDLASKLGMSDRSLFSVHATDQAVYEVMMVTDRSTALALLQRGVKTAEDAVQALEAFGRDDLLQDNAAAANDAFERQVLSHLYISNPQPDDVEDARYVDYIEAMGMMPVRTNEDLHQSVRDGLVRIEDIREITPDLISRGNYWSAIKPALMKLADGSAKYDAEGVKDILKNYIERRGESHQLKSTLEIAQHYGSDFAIEVTPVDYYLMEFAKHLKETNVDEDRSKSLAGYFHRLQKSTERGSTDYPAEDVILFHDAGVDPALVASGQMTRVQAEAIKSHGIAPSVSGGWL